MRSCPLQRSLGRIKYGLHFLNRHWLDYTWILRFLSLAVKAVGIEVKPSKKIWKKGYQIIILGLLYYFKAFRVLVIELQKLMTKNEIFQGLQNTFLLPQKAKPTFIRHTRQSPIFNYINQKFWGREKF